MEKEVTPSRTMPAIMMVNGAMESPTGKEKWLIRTEPDMKVIS